MADIFLALADGDPSKEKFFDLVHAVRATLRLLQWETSEGVSIGSDKLRSEIVESLNNSEKIQFALSKGLEEIGDSLETARQWFAIGPLSRLWQSLKMESSYRKKEVPYKAQALTCDELLSPK